jgi:hypothetical protein
VLSGGRSNDGRMDLEGVGRPIILDGETVRVAPRVQADSHISSLSSPGVIIELSQLTLCHAALCFLRLCHPLLKPCRRKERDGRDDD